MVDELQQLQAIVDRASQMLRSRLSAIEQLQAQNKRQADSIERLARRNDELERLIRDRECING